MSTIKLWNRITNKTVELDISYKQYLGELFTKIKDLYNVDREMSIRIFCIGSDAKPKIFTESSKISELLIISKKIRHFEVFWQTSNHGKQKVDLSPSKMGSVVDGYQRFVSSDPSAGGVTIGNPNGAKVYIPAGALASNANISIKTVMVDESKLNLPKGSKNVTAVVRGDSKKINDEINSGIYDN